MLNIIVDEKKSIPLRKAVCKVLSDLISVSDSFGNNKILKLVGSLVIDWKPLYKV